MFRTGCLSYWLLVFALLLTAGTASTMAAKARPQSNSIEKSQLAPVSTRLVPDDGSEDLCLTGKGEAQMPVSLSGPEDYFVGYKIGTTSYDKQHNGSMGRNIAQGADGRIHFLWMHKIGSSGIRSIYYNSAIYQDGAWVLSHDTVGVEISGVNGGYCNIDTWGDLAIPAWHEGPTENAYSIYSGIDFSSGAGSFATSATPVGATCGGYTSNGSDGAGNYLWPVHHVDVGFAGDPIIHAVGHESTTETEQSFVYFRGSGNPTGWGTCGIFVDSVTDIAGVVRQDPNSDKVAMVWVKPRDYGPDENQYDNDVVYSESYDGGITWGDVINITNHQDSDQERPYANISAMYTSDGCLHVVWDSPGYYEQSGTISIAQDRMLHWDDCGLCISEVVNADNAQSCAPGSWCRNVTKMNLAECEDRLYATYTYYTGDTDEGTTDCSQGGWANGEIYVSVSSSGGQTWGAPINLTNTFSNGCATGDCRAEQYSSTVMYADSLYTFYVGDLDAGNIPSDEGAWTQNPMMFMVNPCFQMEPSFSLYSTPAALGDPVPLSAQEGTQLDTSVTLVNSGNTQTSFSVTVNYISGSGWLAPTPTSGDLPAGCDNTVELAATITAPPAGLYEAEIVVSYSDKTLTIPVSLYSWSVAPPEKIRLRTAANIMNVSIEARAASQSSDAGFVWFVDNAKYLFDGGLILGNSATGEYDFNVYHVFSEQPTASNPWGRLNANCCATVDTNDAYLRTVTGSGVNHDSTIQFDVGWYASTNPDSASFYVLHVALGPGPNFTAPIEHTVIAYAADWDIPSDTASDNKGFVDTELQTVYQQGLYSGSPNGNDLREAGIAYRGNDDSSAFASGGLVWDNPRYVYVANGYHVDSLQNRLPNVDSWFTDIPDSSAAGDDLNSIIVIDNDATIGARDNLEFNIVFWGINPNENPSETRESVLSKADAFICSLGLSTASLTCWRYILCGDDPNVNCTPGDANADGTVNITDAVVIIQWIFLGGHGPYPWSICSGDPNGDCVSNITDAVSLIQWIFADGPEHVSCEQWLELCNDPGDLNPGPWQ